VCHKTAHHVDMNPKWGDSDSEVVIIAELLSLVNLISRQELDTHSELLESRKQRTLTQDAKLIEDFIGEVKPVVTIDNLLAMSTTERVDQQVEGAEDAGEGHIDTPQFSRLDEEWDISAEPRREPSASAIKASLPAQEGASEDGVSGGLQEEEAAQVLCSELSARRSRTASPTRSTPPASPSLVDAEPDIDWWEWLDSVLRDPARIRYLKELCNLTPPDAKVAYATLTMKSPISPLRDVARISRDAVTDEYYGLFHDGATPEKRSAWLLGDRVTYTKHGEHEWYIIGLSHSNKSYTAWISTSSPSVYDTVPLRCLKARTGSAGWDLLRDTLQSIGSSPPPLPEQPKQRSSAKSKYISFSSMHSLANPCGRPPPDPPAAAQPKAKRVTRAQSRKKRKQKTVPAESDSEVDNKKEEYEEKRVHSIARPVKYPKQAEQDNMKHGTAKSGALARVSESSQSSLEALSSHTTHSALQKGMAYVEEPDSDHCTLLPLLGALLTTYSCSARAWPSL
jgi:hypothetical protein